MMKAIKNFMKKPITFTAVQVQRMHGFAGHCT